MGMNIKNEEVQRLAREVAALTGETLTGAIHIALSEKLARLNRLREEQKAEKLRRIREFVASLPPAPPGVTSDHSDLYDENGLPI